MGSFKVKRSMHGKPKFTNPDSRAFVIGNGTSRKEFDLSSLMDHGMLVGCNYFYRDMHPHVLVLSDEEITNTVAKVDKAWMMKNHVFSWYPKGGGKIKKVAFPEKTSAGLMAVYESIETFGCKNIFLVGMDFFGLGSNGKEDNGTINNMYIGKKHYAQSADQVAPTYRNWQRRFQWVLQQFPDVQFWHVAPLDGKSPERMIGAPNFHQVSWENLQEHLNEGAELIDTKVIGPEDEALFLEDNPDNLRAVLERQIVGQENYIYPDRIHPEEVVKLRLQVQQAYRAGKVDPGSYVQIRIKDFDITVGPQYIQTPKGLAYASDDYIYKAWQQEMVKRYKEMGIKLEPFKSIAPKQPAGMTPPPPPPAFGDIPPPPPPPVI